MHLPHKAFYLCHPEMNWQICQTWCGVNLLFLNPYTPEQFSDPKILKMSDPIQVTLIKMEPHDSQSSRENATPSSDTYPLSYY